MPIKSKQEEEVIELLWKSGRFSVGEEDLCYQLAKKIREVFDEELYRLGNANINLGQLLNIKTEFPFHYL